MKLSETKLGQLVKINGIVYVVCAYRTKYHVEVTPLTYIKGKQKSDYLLSAETECEPMNSRR